MNREEQAKLLMEQHNKNEQEKTKRIKLETKELDYEELTKRYVALRKGYDAAVATLEQYKKRQGQLEAQARGDLPSKQSVLMGLFVEMFPHVNMVMQNGAKAAGMENSEETHAEVAWRAGQKCRALAEAAWAGFHAK